MLTENDPTDHVVSMLLSDEHPELKEAGADVPVLDDFLQLVAGTLALIPHIFGIVSADSAPTMRLVQRVANEKHPNAVPPPSDLVRFQVREVFDPRFRAGLLGDADLSTFRRFMRSHGFAAEHADSYWAAHWELPSATQGFEMLHRLRPGRAPDALSFTLDDLRTLLKRQDVAPEYIERLIAVSYSPLTRVDVRRMFHLGVLSKDDVREAYLDLGYDERNAQFLADFTEADVDEQEKALSLDRYARAYREGLIERADFEGALRTLGFAPTAIELAVRLEDKALDTLAKREAEKREDTLRQYRFRIARDTRKGTLDEELIAFELQDLGLSRVDALAMIELNRARGLGAIADLTRADVIAAFKVGVVTEAEARAELTKKGLDAREVSTLIETAKRSQRKTDQKEKDLTRADVLRLTKKGVMTPVEGVARLRALGFSQDAAFKLVDEVAPTPS